MGLNALSIDLEEYFQVSNFDEVIDRDRWHELPSRLPAVTERLLTLLDEFDCRATFFVLGWVAERSPSLIRVIAERGHEIASHGYAHELVHQLGPERFRTDLRRCRRALEAASDTEVVGYRAPSFSITARSTWALRTLAEEGFSYDSSIFPVRHPRYGMPSFPRRPLTLDFGDGTTLREFPLTTIRVGPVALPIAGGAYLRFLPPRVFRWGWDHLERRAEPSILYLHPWELDPGQPRQAVGWRKRLNHYHNLARTEGRVRTLLGRYRFETVSSVLDHLERLGRLPGRRLEEAIGSSDAPLAPGSARTTGAPVAQATGR